MKKLLLCLFLGCACMPVFGQHRDLDSLKNYYEQSIQDKDRAGIVHSLQLIGEHFYFLDEKDSALKYFYRAYDHTDEGNPEERASTELLIGTIYDVWSRYDSAFKYYYRALDALENTPRDDFKRELANLYGNLGTIYRELNEHEKGIVYQKKSLELELQLGDTGFIGDSYNALAGAFYGLGRLDSVTFYLKKALEMYQAINDFEGASILYGNLSEVFSLTNENDSALFYSKRSLDLVREYSKKSLTHAYIRMGISLSALNRYSLAVKYYDSALSLAREQKLWALEAISLKGIAEALSKSGKHKQAMEYYLLYDVVKDSILGKEKMDLAKKYEVLYETGKKEQENIRLAKENELQNLEKKQMKQEMHTLVFGSAGILSALAIIFFLSYRNVRIRTKANEEQNMTRAIFEGEQKERIRIARDLHDSIGQMLSVIKMKISNLKGLSVDEMEATLTSSGELVDRTITEVRSISHNLIPQELNFGLVSAIEELCETIGDKGRIKISGEISEGIRNYRFSKQNELSLYRVVQEIIGNMVKHSGASEIVLKMYEHDGQILINIQDNGKGIDKSRIEQSQGLGWKNILARVNLLNGKLNIQSEKISGTLIEITLPREKHEAGM